MICNAVLSPNFVAFCEDFGSVLISGARLCEPQHVVQQINLLRVTDPRLFFKLGHCRRFWNAEFIPLQRSTVGRATNLPVGAAGRESQRNKFCAPLVAALPRCVYHSPKAPCSPQICEPRYCFMREISFQDTEPSSNPTLPPLAPTSRGVCS